MYPTPQYGFIMYIIAPKKAKKKSDTACPTPDFM